MKAWDLGRWYCISKHVPCLPPRAKEVRIRSRSLEQDLSGNDNVYNVHSSKKQRMNLGLQKRLTLYISVGSVFSSPFAEGSK